MTADLPQPATPTYLLDVGAGPPALATARLFVTSVGRVLELSPEVVEDLKIAVSDVLTAVIVGGAAGRAWVEIDPFGGTLQAGPLSAADASPDGEMMALLSALFDEVRFDATTRSLVIQIRELTPRGS